MPEYRLTPAGKAGPNLDVPVGEQRQVTDQRTQRQNVARGGSVDAGPTFATPVSLEPGQIRFPGQFVGPDALARANTLQNDFLDDPDVTKIELTTPTQTTVDPLEGTYTLDDGRLARRIPASDRWWVWELRLTEA